MKKKILALCLISMVFLTYGQNWNRPLQSDFGTPGFYAKTIIDYDSKIWIGGGGYVVGNFLFSSTTGNENSFTADSSFYTAAFGANSELIETMKKSVAGNFLFAGMKAAYNFNPHLFKLSSTTWTDFGVIPYVRGDSTSFESISAMNFYTTSGSNDSVYVALKPSPTGIGMGIGSQIYRTSIYNTSWQFIDSLIIDNGTVTDIETFNNKIFYSTDGSYQRVFSSANGINFTAASDTGFYDLSQVFSINDLQTHNGALYACTSDNDSCEVWKTTDGFTWARCGIRGLVNTGLNISNACNLLSSLGELFVQGNYYGSPPRSATATIFAQGATNPCIFKLSGNVFTNIGLESATDVNDSYDYPMAYFKNAIYSIGYNYPNNNSLYKGCFSSPATVSINRDTTCLYSSINLRVTSPSSGDLYWMGDAGTTINSYQLFFPSDSTDVLFSSTGNHQIILAQVNGACIDSTISSIYVNPQFILDSLSPYSLLACQGLPVTFTAYNSLGTPPFTYSWEFSPIGGTSSILGGTSNSLTFTPLNPLTTNYVIIKVLDKYDCYASSGSTLYTNPQTDIHGSVTSSTGLVTDGTAFLIHEGTQASLWDTVGTNTINVNGEFLFSGYTAGNYILRVEANQSLYPTLINTYLGNEYLWDSASFAVHGCATTDSVLITMIEITPTVGPGSISGVVYEGAGFGNRISNGQNPIPCTNPIPGVPVKVGKNPSGLIVASGTTDNNGVYSFTNLPIDNYKIYTDIPGYPMDSSYSVSITGVGDSLINLNYYVDSNSVYVDISLTNQNLDAINSSILNLFPNPAQEKATIAFDLKENSCVNFELYNLVGEKIAVILNQNFNKGNYTHSINFNQYALSKGTYLIKAKINNYNNYIKLVVAK